MNQIFSRLFERPNNAILDLQNIEPGWHVVGSSVDFLRNDKYENAYPSIRAIANRFMMLAPTAIDDNGKPYATQPNVVNCLARPNQDMSGVDFRDALAVMTMVHNNVYVLVWERYGAQVRPASENVREANIAGFTFLENVLEVDTGMGVVYEVYTKGSKETYYPYQVIDLHDVNPSNLSKGYSPSQAARRWSRIDDYIADYQAGFFQNGAVPAGQFIITAPTPQEYKDIVANLKKKHKGATKNNNVTYTYAPLDPTTGKPGQAAITWVPFNTTNKDLALKDIFDQANKKIDSVYGVSAFIRSIDEAPNFATAQVIERNFVENTVRPFAIKKWGRFQHELNRITGGLGYGIVFNLVTPHIAEEQKSVAETNKVTVETIQLLTAEGYTLESVINAMKLPNNWKLLEVGTTTQTTINNPKPDVTTDPEEAPEETPNNKVKNMTREDMPGFEDRLKQPAADLMSRQIERAIDGLEPSNATGDATEEDKDEFVTEMMIIVSAILLYGGIQQWEKGKTLLRDAGVDEKDIPAGPYELSKAAQTRYKNYLGDVATSYSDDTATAIRSVLERGAAEGLSSAQITQNLRAINNLDAWRVTRLARSEVNRSGATSSLEAMEKIEEDTDVKLNKVWNTSSAEPCPFCQSLNGKVIGVQDIFVKKGETITGIDGSKFVNDFVNMDVSQCHPNCACYLTYEVVL